MRTIYRKTKENIRKKMDENLSKETNKKVKRIIRKIRKGLSFEKKTYVYDSTPVFTVKQICKIINVKVPKKYEKIKSQPVHKTFLFDKLENNEEIIDNIEYRNYKSPNKVNVLKNHMNRFVDVYEEQKGVLKGTDEELIQMMVEWLYVFNIRGYYYYDYFDYELYHRKIEEAEKFMSRRYWSKVYKVCNNKRYTNILRDKQKFNKKFNKYVNRDFLNIDQISLEEFKDFVKKHPKFFGKPLTGTGGYGAGVIDTAGKNIEKLYKVCKDNKYIIEEIVEQHKEMAKFNKTTVNTIRLYSLLCADNSVKVMMANIRTGRQGKDVDNFHCGGMTAVINPRTGKVVSDAIDLHHNLSNVHPDSKVKFKGFQIPFWDKVVKAVEEMAPLFPQMRHIGWDIAITKDGNIEFIEGNSMPNFDVAQAPDQKGKLFIYKIPIEEIENINIQKK